MEGKLFSEFFIGLFSINPILTLGAASLLLIIVLIVIIKKIKSPSVDKKDLIAWIFLFTMLIITFIAVAYIYATAWI